MILIKNGNVHTMEDEKVEVLDILIRDGKIVELHKDIQNEDAIVIDATGLNVYPGLIDAHSHLGSLESSIGFEGNDLNEMTEPTTPEIRAFDGINPMDETIAEANAGGVTTVCVPPGSANVIGGQTVVYKTHGICIDDMILNPYVAMKAALGENPKRVHQHKTIDTRMRSAQLLRESLLLAQEYKTKKDAANNDIFKMPSYSMKHEALLPLLNNDVDLKIHAHRADDILTAIRIGKEFNLNLTLDHCTEGHLIVNHVKASGYPALVGPSLTHKTKFELSNKTFETPGTLQRAGVKVAIVTDAPIIPQEYLGMCAGLAVKAGMDDYEALKAITINPAEILHLDDKIGSLKVGKDADIIIVSGNILDSRSEVKHTITNGIMSYTA